MVKSIIISLLCTFGYAALHAQNQTKTIVHGNDKLQWELVPFKDHQKTSGVENTQTLYERGSLLKFNGSNVSKGLIEKKCFKTIEQQASKAKKGLKAPLWNNRSLRMHCTNFVLNTTGELVFFELLFFPYKDDLQLYPNEYTTEIKAYISSFEQKMKELSTCKELQEILFSNQIIEL